MKSFCRRLRRVVQYAVRRESLVWTQKQWLPEGPFWLNWARAKVRQLGLLHKPTRGQVQFERTGRYVAGGGSQSLDWRKRCPCSTISPVTIEARGCS